VALYWKSVEWPALSSVTIWETFATESFGRPVRSAASETLPGAAAMLDAIAATGVYLGVVSNKKGDFLRVEARHLGWDRYFGALVGALDAERDKPAPEPVRLALKGSGVTPGPAVWIAGDADIDLECAHNAGCTAVLIRAAAPGHGEFDAHPPAGHFGGCDALSKYVKNL